VLIENGNVLIENESAPWDQGMFETAPLKRAFTIDGHVMVLLDNILGPPFPGQSVPPLTITLVALGGSAGSLSPTP
jgi:hypothetical protein